MTTWHVEPALDHVVDPAVQADLDALITAALEHARGELAEHGTFHPFGAKVLLDGTVHTFAATALPADGAPKNVDLRALMRAGLKRKRDHLRAAAVVAMGTDAEGKLIEVEVDHSGGPGLTARVPYERAFFGHRVTLGELRATSAPSFIWS